MFEPFLFVLFVVGRRHAEESNQQQTAGIHQGYGCNYDYIVDPSGGLAHCVYAV